MLSYLNFCDPMMNFAENYISKNQLIINLQLQAIIKEICKGLELVNIPHFLHNFCAKIYITLKFMQKGWQRKEKNQYLKNDMSFWGEIKSSCPIFRRPFHQSNKTNMPWSIRYKNNLNHKYGLKLYMITRISLTSTP